MTHHDDATTASGRHRRLAPTTARRLARPGTAIAALAVAALTIAACGSSNPTAATTTKPTSGTGTAASSPGTTAATATVKTTNTSKFGNILVNSAGMALYTYGPNNGGTTNMCMGVCLQNWPALTVPAATTPALASGVSGSLGTAMQADGTLQVTYNGELLYTFVNDTSPGQVTGDGVAKFSVAKETASSATGSGVPANNTPGTTKPPTTTKAPTTTAASGGGYKY